MKKSELRMKDVIDINRGKRLGYIEDVEFDVKAGKIRAIILPADDNFLIRFFSKKKDIIIGWDDISLIGEDVILVNVKDI